MAPALTVPPAEDAPLVVQKKNGVDFKTEYEVSENYDGDYRFAPIEEAEVSRAMIKRFVSSRICLKQAADQTLVVFVDLSVILT